MLKLVACHGSLRAGKTISRDEMLSLLKNLKATNNPSTCPHGRPTMVKFSRAEIEKIFKRT